MKRNKDLLYDLFICALFSILSACYNNAFAQKIINLSDYGVISDSRKNASPNIARAIKDAGKCGNCIIKFPGGRIDIWPEGCAEQTYYISNNTENDSIPKAKIIGMLFKNLSNVVIEGNNTLLVYHGKMMLMAIDHCDNFEVKNLRFDFERPTVSEMKIISKTDSDVVAEIDPHSWYHIKYQTNHQRLVWYGEDRQANNFFVSGYNPYRQKMYYSQWNAFSNSDAIEQQANKVKFTGDFKNTNFNTGDILSIRDPTRDEVGIFNACSKNIKFENLNLYYVHGMGIVSQLSKNVIFNKISIAPQQQSGRIIAAFADCLHFSNCYGTIKIANCLFSGTHDDPINIHGTYLYITKADGNKLTVRFMHSQTWGFNPFDINDSVELVNHVTLLPLATSIVISTRMISKKEIELTLNHDIAQNITVGDGVDNITKNPSVTVENNRFEHVLTRGVLVTTRRSVIIKGNIFYRTGMYAILIGDDCNSWFESGPVKNVMICDNKFLDCAYLDLSDEYVIDIQPETHNYEQGRYVHSQINITKNLFEIYDSRILFARNVNGLNFFDNIIEKKTFPQFTNENKAAFSFEHCNNVRTNNNKYNLYP